MTDRTLLAEFEPTTPEQWREAAEALLKGAPFDKIMLTKTAEGITLQPIYRQPDPADLPHLDHMPGDGSLVRGTHAAGYHAHSWAVAQELVSPLYDEFNAALKNDLRSGQTAVHLLFDKATRLGLDPDEATIGDVGRGGVSIASVLGLAKSLRDVDWQKYPIYLQAGTSGLAITAMLAGLARQQGIALDQIRGAVDYNPLGCLAKNGSLPVSLSGAFNEMARLTRWAVKNMPNFRTIGVNTSVYHEGGANARQELAAGLATGVVYLKEMIERGLAVDDLAPRMRFTFQLGPKFFMEIAKFRAARMLWAQVIKAFGGNEESQKMTIHARTGTFNKTIYDPYVNMLRAATEAFSGVMGSVDSLHVGPFDDAYRLADDFSRRIARNTQIILKEECHFDQVIDPAGGSWFVESLTDELAQSAWKLFQDIEAKGGMTAMLMSGEWQDMIAATAAERLSKLANRSDILVGINQYANPLEKKLEARRVDYASVHAMRFKQLQELKVSPDHVTHMQILNELQNQCQSNPDDCMDKVVESAFNGATIGELSKILRADDGEKPEIKPVVVHRLAEQFESLREAVNKSSSTPKVFLIKLGPVKQHKPRADFSSGFFAVGGFEVITSDQGFDNPEDGARAALESGAPVAVICSTDPTYPEVVPPIVKTLKAVKPEMTVVLAGYPKDQIDAHKASGVDEFIHVKANAYEILKGILSKIGVFR